MIYGYMLENELYTSKANPAPTREEINKQKNEMNKEEERRKKELEQEEIEKENKAQYSKSVDYLDTPFGCADQRESDDDINESFRETYYLDTYAKYVTESTILIREAFGNIKCPPELKLDVPDLLSDSKFKSKLPKLVKYYLDNNAKEKDLSRQLYMIYYGILGSTFGDKSVKSHGSTVTFLVDYVNKYCTDKHKTLMKKDIEKTIDTLEKMKLNRKELTKLQLDWLKDITTALKKFK